MNVIIDYKAGNLLNLKNALDHLGLPNQIVQDAHQVRLAQRILFPGVGAFAPAIANLKKSGMLEALHEKIQGGTPFLGICVGAQLLFQEGEEAGNHQGLGVIEGKVIRFRHDLKIPQIGWNQVSLLSEDPLFQKISNQSYFYFVHSYHFVPDQRSDILATTEYGYAFASVIRRQNVWGVQFHPEKSQEVGLQLLKNFCTLT